MRHSVDRTLGDAEQVRIETEVRAAVGGALPAITYSGSRALE